MVSSTITTKQEKVKNEERFKRHWSCFKNFVATYWNIYEWVAMMSGILLHKNPGQRGGQVSEWNESSQEFGHC